MLNAPITVMFLKFPYYAIIRYTNHVLNKEKRKKKKNVYIHCGASHNRFYNRQYADGRTAQEEEEDMLMRIPAH